MGAGFRGFQGAVSAGRRGRGGAWAPWLWSLAAAGPFAILASGGPQRPPSERVFERDVLPIFRAHCFQCHGKDAQMGGLRLDSLAAVKKGGLSGAVVKAGKANDSLLVMRVEGRGGKPQMPMGFKPLSETQISVIRNWIDQGAKSEPTLAGSHWAYVAPKRPPVPKVREAGWVRNPLDAFILARLESEGLRPSPEASKETLLRRVSLDLTGLPPTLDEIRAFLADKSPNAYEKVVERLLASPHYGERQARVWLDLSRYADSDGYEKDLNRAAWKYRDWLIEAFNRNLPYDRFILEQMAGDLLPNPTTDQRIATGFHRNAMFNQEGGVDQAEALFLVTIDRLDTTGYVFLGSTVHCARCHDHKYDPFTQRDFYRMLAFFSNPDYTPRGDPVVSEEKWQEPIVDVPTEEQALQLRRHRSRIAELERRLKARTPELQVEQADWERWSLQPADWTALAPVKAAAASGAELRHFGGGEVQALGRVPDRDLYALEFAATGRAITGMRLEALPSPDLPNRGPGRADNGNFVLTRVEVRADGKPVKVRLARASHEQAGFPVGNTLDGNSGTGWAVSPKFGVAHAAVFEFAEPIGPSAQKIEVVLDQRSGYLKHVLGRFRLSATSARNPAMREVSAEVRELLRKSERTFEDRARLAEAFAAMAPSLDPIRQRLAEERAALAELQSQIPKAYVLRDKPARGPLSVAIRHRGEFTSVGETVTAGTPEFLPPMPRGAPKNRLGFAMWIASTQNPLTARVQVNRMWSQYFGRGIVETEEDFGTQGSRPSHPELLDWLATELMSRKWDLKAIHRLIVTSATYRQSSKATAQLLEKDPNNVLLARGPRFRLEAEALRDNALAASGLLSRKIGGPSVFPHQPEGVWNLPFNGATWTTSKGEDLFRRGIYTFIKRTSPYPAFINFDATSREVCTVRRVRTNTPTQALTLLNDPAFFEAAKALGRRMTREGGATDEARVAHGFLLCTGRGPTPTESQRLLELLTSLRTQYRAHPDEARAVAGDPESAAWTLVANVLLNLDETITKS